MPSHDTKMSDFDRQMPPKVSQMTPQSDPKLTRFKKKTQIGNLMKTTLFTTFLKGWDLRNQYVFPSRIIKNHACKPKMLSAASNHINYQTMTQKCPQRVT